ncbi:hypothetical protein RSOL_036090 [Rhizoctonia solani AG-3 Rhs1AP]|uniref:Uncharacterized protein n=1 Tax=Rhizoctonia solani AG-3 Rhs1AP TaxID=1086054 RepID=X8IZ34_9AGAM|nr:hypothetical protein RSOL_036090 [Rhizoctonia solani AG-3 Rhs1AP]
MERHSMEIESTPSQSSPETPWPETDYTEEEFMYCMPGERVSRVLHLFEFQKDGVPVDLPIGEPKSAYKDITAIGIVGTLTGKAGLFAQCCWFGLTYALEEVPHVYGSLLHMAITLCLCLGQRMRICGKQRFILMGKLASTHGL